jgi:demethylspheroidene O-methyltransferase
VFDEASADADADEGVSDRFFRWRNSVLSSRAFQRWAARFPLTRPVAKRRTAALFDLCAGFVYSQVLFAGVQLGLFEALADGPRTLDEVSRTIGMSPEASRRLLDASAALQLVETRPGGRYGLGVHGAALLANPSVQDMVRHHALLYRDLADPVALLRGERTTELQRFWGYVGDERPQDEEAVAAYSRLMASSQELVAEDVVEAYPFGRHQHLLDVGGGEGAFVKTVAAAAPSVRFTLFDLPPVASRAKQRLAGLGDRVTVVGGDAYRDPLPPDADILSLVRILHDHDDEGARQLLAAAHRALPADGTLLVAEPMSGTPGAEPVGDAYFGFYLLAMGQGRPRTREVLTDLLEASGFASVREVKTRRPLLTRLLVARRA